MILVSLIWGLAGVAVVGASQARSNQYNLKPFTIDLSSNVEHMRDLINNSQLPREEEYPGVRADLGIPLGTLNELKDEWISQFDWEAEQKEMNSFDHFTATIEGLSIHFIHEKSANPDSIPLLLAHGWPGSFLEFVPIITELTKSAVTTTGKNVSFHVVVPSLPGFAFSTRPPENWTAERDTARVFNTLMIDVLGYDKYAVFGTDWGAAPTYGMYEFFNDTCRAGHFAFLPFFPPTFQQLSARNISLDPLETIEQQITVDWSVTGNSYLLEQTTKPNTIGLALYDSPIGQLAWIGEKYLNWSDPQAGTQPSVLTHQEILRSVSLYYLTKTFVSGVYIYAQNPNGFKTTYTKAQTDAPMLFSAFKYNPGFWVEEIVATVGNLVLYRNHEFGGHFPGLDNPPAITADLREIGTYWEG